MKIFVEFEGEKVTGWGTSKFSNDSEEFDIDDDHPMLQGGGTYYYRDGQFHKDDVALLSMAKTEKDAELNKACNEAISNGFDLEVDGEIYHFSFDIEAQFNYQGAETLLSKGTVETIDFTVFKDNEYHRIPVNSELMERITLAILMHKNSNIVKYREVLLPMVRAAKTIEEVEAITWDSV